MLNVNEIASLHLYTQETELYKQLNACLRWSHYCLASTRRWNCAFIVSWFNNLPLGDRSKDRATLLPPWRPYLKLILSALYKLPPYAKHVYRGVRLDLATFFPTGEEKIWYCFGRKNQRSGKFAALWEIESKRRKDMVPWEAESKLALPLPHVRAEGHSQKTYALLYYVNECFRWGFSSCTHRVDVMSNPMFVGDKGGLVSPERYRFLVSP